MFIPVLCKIFLDEAAPDHVLEVTARALTYYLDVSADCARRLASVDGSLQAIVQRVATVTIDSRPSKDLAEQCTKVLNVCLRFFSMIYFRYWSWQVHESQTSYSKQEHWLSC